MNCEEATEIYKKVVAAMVKDPATYVYLTALPVYCEEKPNTDYGGYMDGKKIVINAAMHEDEKDVFHVLLHEVGHFLHKHIERFWSLAEQEPVSMKLYNIAADLKVDSEIDKEYPLPARRKEWFGKIKTEANLSDEMIEKYSTEELYDYLRKQVPEIHVYVRDFDLGNSSPSAGSDNSENKGECSGETGTGKGDGNDKKENKGGGSRGKKKINDGDEMIARDLEEGNAEEARKKLIDKAYAMSRLAGQNKGMLFETVVNKYVKSGVPWHILLRNYLYDELKKNKYTWTRINRRSRDIPGYYRQGGINLWLLIDTSGSISDSEFEKFVNVIADAVQNGAKAHVVFWDTSASEIYKFKKKSDLYRKVKFSRYGGTEFSVALDRIEGKTKSKDIVMVLTDGYWFDDQEELRQRIMRIKAKKWVLVTVADVPIEDLWYKVFKVEGNGM